MTWITAAHGAYEGHFIDGYFHNGPVNGALAAREQQATRARIVFGAVTRFRPGSATDYEALAREFRTDLDPTRCAWTLVTRLRQAAGARRFVDHLMRHAHFEPKEQATYAAFADYQCDVEAMLRRVLSIYAAPLDLSVGVLHRAGFDIFAVMAPKQGRTQ